MLRNEGKMVLLKKRRSLLNNRWKREQRFFVETNIAHERLTKQNENTNAVLTAQEKERTIICRELHENLSQVLAVAKLYVDMARDNEENRNTYLEQTSGLIINVIGEMKRISNTLESPDSVISLEHCINNLLDDLIPLYSINFKLSIYLSAENELDAKLQMNIFRIVQEQINNILEHAEAKNISIDIDSNDTEVVLLISDDGKGYDIETEKDSIGIINIKSRAQLCNGRVITLSQPSKGYDLKVILPLYPFTCHVPTRTWSA